MSHKLLTAVVIAVALSLAVALTAYACSLRIELAQDCHTVTVSASIDDWDGTPYHIEGTGTFAFDAGGRASGRVTVRYEGHPEWDESQAWSAERTVECAPSTPTPEPSPTPTLPPPTMTPTDVPSSTIPSPTWTATPIPTIPTIQPTVEPSKTPGPTPVVDPCEMLEGGCPESTPEPTPTSGPTSTPRGTPPSRTPEPTPQSTPPAVCEPMVEYRTRTVYKHVTDTTLANRANLLPETGGEIAPYAAALANWLNLALLAGIGLLGYGLGRRSKRPSSLSPGPLDPCPFCGAEGCRWDCSNQ